MLPGALGTTTAATAGVGGIVRLVRAGVSARWMSEKCAEWGEDAVSRSFSTCPPFHLLTSHLQFFLSLYDYLTHHTTPEELVPLSQALLPETEGTLFDRELKEYERLADRAEELIVRHCVREVLGDLKTYLGR